MALGRSAWARGEVCSTRTSSVGPTPRAGPAGWKQPGSPARPPRGASPVTPSVGVVSRLHVIDGRPCLSGGGSASWPSWVNRPSPDRPAEGWRGWEQEAREGPNGKARCLARVCQGCCPGVTLCGSPGRRGQLLGLLGARGWGSSLHFVTSPSSGPSPKDASCPQLPHLTQHPNAGVTIRAAFYKKRNR